MPVDPSLDLTPAFENFDGWLAGQPEERKQAVERTFAFTPPALLDSRRKQWLSAGLISQRTGREPGEVLNNFAAYSGAFARDPRGLNMPVPPKDAGEFYNAAKMKLGQEKTDKAAALASSQAGMQAALEDKGLLSGMADYAGDAMAHPEQEATNTAFFNAYTAAHQIIAPHAALLKAVPDAVERTMDGKGTPEDQQTIIDAHEQLADMPDNERQHVMTALQLEANKRGAVNAATKGGSGYMGALVQMMQMGIPGGSQGSRSFMQQTGEAAGRFANAGMHEGPNREHADQALDNIPTSGDIFYDGQINNAADARKYVGASIQHNVTYGALGSYGSGAALPAWNKMTLTPEQGKLIQTEKDRAQRLLQVRGEMTAMGHTIDPVPNLFASTFGSSGVAMGTMMLSRGAALPILSSLYKGSEYNDLSTKYPQMSAADKSEISSISGAVQGLGDMVEFSALKRLPGLNSLIQGGWKAALIKKALLRGAGVNLTENAVELVQDYATPVLMAALKSDVPGYSWDDEVKDFAKGRLDVAIGMLPLTLVGLGAASIGEYRGTKNLLTLNQKMAEDGYIEKDRIVTIDALAAGNTAKAQASIQDAFQRRDPAVAAEYQEKADKQDVARSNAASELTRQGLLPDITIQGGKYVVTSDGKSATFGTWDQARDVATQHMTEMERHQADLVAHMAASLNLGENETVNLRQRAETMGERIAAGSITPAKALDAAIASGIVKGVDASKAADIAHHIFGGGTLDERSDLLRQTVENIIVLGSNDVAGGKSNSIVNLRAGQVVNPHPFRTVLEETVEGRWKSGLAAGKFTKAQGVAWVKLAEQATGHNFTEGMTHEEMLASAEASPRALTEAISRIVDAEILGRMTGGKHLAPGAVSASLDMSDKEQSALAAILAAFREFFKVALHAAAKLIQARKEGKLGAEYDALLDHLTGSNGQHVHEAGSLKEQAHLIDTSGYSEATPGPNGETFSLRPGDFAARMEAAMAPFAGTPEQRALMGKIALERVKRLGSEWIAKAAKIRGKGNIEAERRSRFTIKLNELLAGKGLNLEAAEKSKDAKDYEAWQRYQESKDILIKSGLTEEEAGPLASASAEKWRSQLVKNVKDAITQAKAESEAWAESEIKKSGSASAQREMLKGSLRTLDALLSAFPADVRVKVGGYVKLAGLATDEAMLKEIERRIGKMAVELEKHLKKEATKQIAKVFEKARAKSKGGQKPVGKIGADAHDWFDLAEKAFGMDSKQTEDRIAEIQGRLDTDPTITPEDAASMQSEVAILQTFGGWENMGSEERTDALYAAEDAYKGGREAWQARVEARQTKDKERIETLLQSLGNRGRLSEKSDSSKKGKKNGASQALEFLFTFAQGLRQWFGKNPVTQEFSRQELGRQIAYRDTINAHETEFAKIVDDEVKGNGGWWNKRRAREQFIFDNTRPVHTVKILEGRHVETEKMKAEDARSVVDDKNAAYTPEQRAQMQDQLDTIDAAKAAGVPAKRNVTFTTLKNAGEAKTIDISQAEISWILALHAQEKLRPSLIKSGFDEASIKEMETVEDPRMRNIRGWMVKKLKAEHAAISAIYSDLMGVSLPSIASYFPARFVHDGDVQGMALGGGSIPNGGMKSGPLKNRKTHTAQVALDFESHGTNLFTLFHGHAAEMGYWKQYAPLMRDIKAVLNNGQLKEAFKTAHGMSALKDMNAWVQALESGGLQDSHFNLAAAKLVQGFMGRYAATRLGFKLGTHMINMSSGLNALLDTSIPFKDVMASYGRTIASFTGLVDKPKMTPLQAMRNDALQRRLQAGTTAEQRFAKDIREHAKPGIARDIMALGAHSLGVVDTMAGAWAAAASYDANFRIAKKSGLSDADAHAEATEGMERTVATTFQPVENSNKSLGELSGSLAWKLMTIFNTEVRQKIALEVSIVKRFLKGDATLGEAGRIVIVNHLVMGTFVWAMRAAAKDMMNGDDGDDDPAWEVSDWLASVITGPLSGIPFIGSALNYQIASTIGGKAYKSTDPFTGTAAEIQQGWRMLARHEDTGEILKGLVHLMNGSAILVGSDATVAAAILGNAGLQIYQIGENLMDSLFD
jgi:hypothetical protein